MRPTPGPLRPGAKRAPGQGLRTATGHGAHRTERAGFVEGDEQHAVGAKRGGFLDARHPFAQKLIHGAQPAAAGRRRTRIIVSVVAQVRGDEYVVRRGGGAAEVVAQLREIHHVRVAAPWSSMME